MKKILDPLKVKTKYLMEYYYILAKLGGGRSTFVVLLNNDPFHLRQLFKDQSD